jgi:hypothetical protein
MSIVQTNLEVKEESETIRLTVGELNALLQSAKSEGWRYRDAKIGTYYEVGWYQDEDETGLEVWQVEHTTKSLQNAANTAYRWGCDYRAIHTNPYELSESQNKNGKI